MRVVSAAGLWLAGGGKRGGVFVDEERWELSGGGVYGRQCVRGQRGPEWGCGLWVWLGGGGGGDGRSGGEGRGGGGGGGRRKGRGKTAAGLEHGGD